MNNKISYDEIVYAEKLIKMVNVLIEKQQASGKIDEITKLNVDELIWLIKFDICKAKKRTRDEKFGARLRERILGLKQIYVALLSEDTCIKLNFTNGRKVRYSKLYSNSFINTS